MPSMASPRFIAIVLATNTKTAAYIMLVRAFASKFGSQKRQVRQTLILCMLHGSDTQLFLLLVHQVHGARGHCDQPETCLNHSG